MIEQRSNFSRHCRRCRRGLIARQMGWPGMRSDRMWACRIGDGPVPGRDPGRLLLGRAKCDSPGCRSAWAGILGEETMGDASTVGSASTEAVTGVYVVAATNNSGGKGSVASRRESSGAMAGITAAVASESAVPSRRESSVAGITTAMASESAPSVAATAAVATATTAAGVATASSASVSAPATTAAASGSNSVGRIGKL